MCDARINERWEREISHLFIGLDETKTLQIVPNDIDARVLFS